MKTRSFIVRVMICLLLSLIPLTDVENMLYATRFKIRGKPHAPTRVLIVEVPSSEFETTSQLRQIQNSIQARHASRVTQTPKTDTNAFLYDRDGYVRRAPSRLAAGGAFWINYRGPAGSIPRCTLRQVQIGSPGCEVAGRDVLLIDDVEDTVDIRTPFAEMSRAEVIANAWNTTLTASPIYRISFLSNLIMVLAVIVVVAFYVLYYPIVIHATAVVGTGIVLVLGIFQLLFQYANVYIPSANLTLSMLITYLVFSGYRLAFQENLQWRNNKQAQYLRELDEMKTNFLSLVSHDLKTPIAKIQAVTERLKREMALPEDERPDPREWKDLLDSIEMSNNDLKHTIGSLLNLSKIESQKVILNRKSNDINVLIRQTLKRLRPLAQQKGIQIEERLEPLFSVECDEDLMRQVISNLVDNAIKYSTPGTQVVVQSHEDLHGKNPVVRVSVKDTGPGIPKDQLPRMFRKFSRLQGTPGPGSVKGTGLGLYLSKYFIELHGGSIRVESALGEGTTFSFTLPIEVI